MKRIIIDDVWKRFSIGTKRQQRALEKVLSLLSGREPRKNFWALKSISFSAKAGEIIGLIGENGSGKSTLLRIIAGIYEKDRGKIMVNGSIAPLINLQAALDLRLNVMDNIYLCCSIFGLKSKEIKERIKEIISFAGLQEFVNTKLYQLSSGMLVRLAFSIAIHSIVHKKPEILLLDEVMEVGDEHYQNKCMKKIKELTKSGATVIIVSHDAKIIKENCKRIIWLDKGQIIKDGGKEILYEYIKSNKK